MRAQEQSVSRVRRLRIRSCVRSSSDRYDPATNEWTDLNELPCAISAPGLAVC